MKKIKLYQVSIFLLCSMCLFACNKSKGESFMWDQQSSSISSESSENESNKKTIDSLVSQIEEFQKMYASLNDDYINLHKEVEKLSTKCNKIESSYLKSLVGSIVVVLLILAVVLFLLHNRLKKLKTILDQHTKFIESMRGEFSQTSTKNQEYKVLQFDQKIINLESRIARMEEKTLRGASPLINQQQPMPEINKTPKSEKVYFGSVVKTDPPYFSTLVSSIDEARFSASITGSVASFEPLNLDILKSFDYMDCAVDISGERCSIARNMIIGKKGRAECKGDKWVIVEKAVVVLS